METALTVILFILLVIVGIFVFVLYLGVAFFLGWLIIIIVVVSDDWELRLLDGNPLEMMAMHAVILYAILFVTPLLLGLFGFRRELLPHVLKPIAWMFPHPATRIVKQGTQRSVLHDTPGRALAHKLREEPTTNIGRKIQTIQQKKMAKESEAEAEWLRSQEELAEKVVQTDVKRGGVRELRLQSRRFRK